MPIVLVDWWEGRTTEQKKQLAQGITSTMQEMGIPPEAVQIVINDIPKYNWAIAGKLASEQ